MRIAKEKISSLKSATTTKGRSSVPVTAKNASQLRGRTGMKNASGGAGRTAGRKSSGKGSVK